MEVYPSAFVAHNVPLVILSGLGSQPPHVHEQVPYPLLEEKGIRITSMLPPVTGPSTEELLGIFMELDAQDAAWNGRPGRGKMGTMGFKIKAIGKNYVLPPRKAAPSTSPTLPPVAQNTTRSLSQTPVLHSPLSPLTPGSPTFPDGILSPLWIRKHQTLLPSVFIAFFNFTSDPNLSTLHDNQLKTEINAMRSSISASSYKIRLVIVLVSEPYEFDADIDDRLANIRKATGLDPKNSMFFLPPDFSTVELRGFVGTILSSIYPSCIEYYRDLSKHARRKKTRGAPPPPNAGLLQSLSSQGWNVRYEIKLGVFAEFRQEMDAAARSFEGAYQCLFSEDMFESTTGSDPLFKEYRLLADVLAIRILRCLLWNGQTTSAVQSWSHHRSRVQGIEDRKGMGTFNDGWEAWEANWSSIMAETIERAELPIFAIPEQLRLPDVQPTKPPAIYAPLEKAIERGERFLPWEVLHHEGYWLNRSVRHTRAQRRLASASKKERYAPEHPPAFHLGSKSAGIGEFDYSRLLVDTLRKSAHQFEKRHQRRAVERLELNIARELAHLGYWNDTTQLLKPLWHKLSWRQAGWWHLLEEVAWLLRESARNTGDAETLLSVEWELMSRAVKPKPGWQHDLSKCLDGLQLPESRPRVVLQADEIASCLIVTFAFGVAEGHVGEELPSQLIITSRAHENSAPITLSEVRLVTGGSQMDITITHDGSTHPTAAAHNGPDQLYHVFLHEVPPIDDESSPSRSIASNSRRFMIGSGDLSFVPGNAKAFTLNFVPREAGDNKVVSVTLSIKEQLFDMDVVVPFHDTSHPEEWWLERKTGIVKKKLPSKLGNVVKILPKPPKMYIGLPNLRSSYYTDEHVAINIHLVNEEDEGANVTLDVRLLGQSAPIPELTWASNIEGADGGHARSPGKVLDSQSSHVPTYHLGLLPPSTSRTETIIFQAEPDAAAFVLEVKTLYHLSSDPDTPISKTFTTDMAFVGAFEANYDFWPCVHPEPWPSYFHVNDEQDKANDIKPAQGLLQTWSLSARIASFAAEPLIIEDVSLPIIEAKNGATCTVSPRAPQTPESAPIAPNGLQEHRFQLTAQKSTLDDQRPSPVDTHLQIRWRRAHPASLSTLSSLAVPQLLVPFGEPRVLAAAAAQPSTTTTPRLVLVDYTLENPSMHLLSFTLTMEASEQFAFSGAKFTTLQLLPFSRRTVRYRLLPSVRAAWIQPLLRVVDVYFNQTLKVVATEGVRVDRKGILVWVGEEG